MSKLAVIGTFYQRHENTELLFKRVLSESTRPPDEFWVMCEGLDDYRVAKASFGANRSEVNIVHLPTPRNEKTYTIIPYSNKINWALDRVKTDYITYLDNGSMPHIFKYEYMVNLLDAHSEFGAVFCTQDRDGYIIEKSNIQVPIKNASCILNYTQVMHKRTGDRWPLDMQLAVPYDRADAVFWTFLHNSLGNFYPVITPDLMLDYHYMPDAKAVGL